MKPKPKIPWYQILLATQVLWLAIISARMKAEGAFEIIVSIVLPFILCGAAVFSIYASIYAAAGVHCEPNLEEEKEE